LVLLHFSRRIKRVSRLLLFKAGGYGLKMMLVYDWNAAIYN
jgi:hypothetical protein